MSELPKISQPEQEKKSSLSATNKATAKADAEIERLAQLHKEDIERIEQLGYPADQLAQVVLVLLGEQPAVDLFVDPQSDPLQEIKESILKSGLVIRELLRLDRGSRMVSSAQRETREEVILCVARTPEIADELMHVQPEEGFRTENEKYARLMGFPQTAIDAFVGRAPLLKEHLSEAGVDDSEIIFGLRFSKLHMGEELDFLRRRSQIIKRYAPRLWDVIITRHRELKAFVESKRNTKK